MPIPYSEVRFNLSDTQPKRAFARPRATSSLYTRIIYPSYAIGVLGCGKMKRAAHAKRGHAPRVTMKHVERDAHGMRGRVMRAGGDCGPPLAAAVHSAGGYYAIYGGTFVAVARWRHVFDESGISSGSGCPGISNGCGTSCGKGGTASFGTKPCGVSCVSWALRSSESSTIAAPSHSQ